MKIGPITFEHCWTGRRWVNVCKGVFAIGFGPYRFIEDVMLFRRFWFVKHRYNKRWDMLKVNKGRVVNES